MKDCAKLTLPELEDALVGHQEALADLRQRVAGHEDEVRQALRELERRLMRPAGHIRDGVRGTALDVPAATAEPFLHDVSGAGR